MEDNSQSVATPPVQEVPSSQTPPIKRLSIYIAVIFVVLLAMGGLIFLNLSKTGEETNVTTAQPQQSIPQTQTMATVSPTPGPIIIPVTSSNADQTLSNTDASIQQTTDQVNKDLNDLNKINTSLDNSSGL